MFLRTAGALLFTCLSVLTAPHVLMEAKAQGGTQSLVLSNKSIGSLELDKNAKLELQDLRKVFAGLSVEQKIGQQDGPDFVYYQVSDSEGELFWIKADEDSPTKIDSIHVVSAKIPDQYGLRVGSTYAQVLRIRPRLRVETNDHFHTYIGHPKENIVYELAVSYRKGYQGPDRNPTKQELASSKVKALMWFAR